MKKDKVVIDDYHATGLEISSFGSMYDQFYRILRIRDGIQDSGPLFSTSSTHFLSPPASMWSWKRGPGGGGDELVTAMNLVAVIQEGFPAICHDISEV